MASPPAFCQPLRHWGLHLHISLSRTLGCWVIFYSFKFWTSYSSKMSAVREQCIEETPPCWSCWHQKTSATSFWQP